MTKISLLSVTLIAATAFAAPAIAQENNTVARHTQTYADDNAPPVQRFANRDDHCVRAPDVGAFASDPYPVPPCLPNTISRYQ
jgi:hypothetical protein